MTWRRRDDNQSAIAAALRAAGYSVADLASVGAGVPDLLVGGELACPGCGRSLRANVLLEIKNTAGRGLKLTPAEAAFFTRWAGQAAIVKDIDQALDLLAGGAWLKE